MLLKRTIAVKAVVTEHLRQELETEFEAKANQQHQALASVEKQAQEKIRQTQLLPQGLEPGMQLRKQWEAEKAQRLQQIRLIDDERDKARALQDGQEIVVGSLESLVEVEVGDNLREKGLAEVLLRDGVIVEIREGGPAPVLKLVEDSEEALTRERVD